MAWNDYSGMAVTWNDYSGKAYNDTYNGVHISSMYWSLKSEKKKKKKDLNNWNANPGV